MSPSRWSVAALATVLGGCTLLYDVDDLPVPPPVVFGPPTNLTASPERERTPTLAGDGSYLYYTTVGVERPDEDIWRRDHTGATWSAPAPVVPFSTAATDDRVPRLTSSGQQLYIVRHPDGASPAIMVALTTGVRHAWQDPVPVTNVGGTGANFAVAPCADGATLFVVQTVLTHTGLQEISDTINATVDVGPLVNLQTPSATDDCLQVFVAAQDAGADLDLFVLRRASRDAPWAPPERLDPLSTAADERSPTVTADGTTIVFEREGDLWAARAPN